MMKKWVSFLLVVSCVLVLPACGDRSTDSPSSSVEDSTPTVEAILDISAIADKTPEDVAKVLGEPSISETGTFDLSDGTVAEAISNTYSDGTEILFISGQAGRITVYPPAGNTVADGAALIGLSSEAAGSSYYDTLGNYSWDNNTEYFSITAFDDGDGTISYIYIITQESFQ